MTTHYDEVQPYTTKDGSIIRELMQPLLHGNKNQSLAEATIPCGMTTFLHRHLLSEELYHITSGQGLMQLGGKQFSVTEGDTVHIPPGTPHAIKNDGSEPLKMLCCCAPPYSHEDTELL